MEGTQSLLLQAVLADAQPTSEDMEVVLELDSSVKSSFHRRANAQDAPELVRLRKFIAEFTDPIAKDPATWALWDYIIAARKYPGVAEKVLAAVVKGNQCTYREEYATQKESIWTMYYDDLRQGKDPQRKTCEGMIWSTRNKLHKNLNPEQVWWVDELDPQRLLE